MNVVLDPARLAALHDTALLDTALLDTASEEGFDRLTRVAASILRVPITLVALVEDDRKYFKSHVGLPERYRTNRQTPLTHSFCKHLVLTREPLGGDITVAGEVGTGSTFTLWLPLGQ